MHDLSYFRSNFDRIAQRLATRGDVSSLDASASSIRSARRHLANRTVEGPPQRRKR